jgi:predicted DNA-binding protein
VSTQILVRIEPDLKNKVNRFAKAEGKTTSEVVRELLEDYVRSRDIGAYIDDLWDRTGKKLKSKRMGPDEIQRIIKEVRGRK